MGWGEEIAEQDERVRRAGLEIWLGAEPTFTLRESQDPPWLWQAEGGDKEMRAAALLADLAPRLGAARLQRAPGRHFPEEPAPRFCLGALLRRGPPAPAAGGLDGPPLPAPAPGPDERWLTVTPDPGVVEVNLAPSPDLATFAADAQACYRAAAAAGLSPVRFRYNGQVSDSGGGGQLTLGGPSPEASPFFRRPQLLPRLVRYLHHHPSLSYAFSPDCAGSAGQGPRPDEGVREIFDELPVALDRLAARGDDLSPAELWSALAPMLVDPSGNSHRAELNVEKLWNPHLPGRGMLGLVELRALRMPGTPARLTAVAALFRALAARLATRPFEEPLRDWGRTLHDRAALPFFLARDLVGVLQDLDHQGFGLGPLLSDELTAEEAPLALVPLGGARLELRPALEFWPLQGDVASQERSTARLVDASSARLELRLDTGGGEVGRLSAGGWELPLQQVARGLHLAAVRWRTFAPSPGLHPGLPAHDPLRLCWERGGEAREVLLHGWRPQGGGYDGLPADGAEAARRRAERVQVRSLPPPAVQRAPPGPALTLDLRRLPLAS
ncbi:MAG: transglutaminase family protein [Deltaproteobacteria bacterium]|nr:transglutaminase family protein [Deltaproteobacteria bacterium]